ncbi:hypothetical protein FRC06_004397 [Ceratobasidium sp. 370]|nr:hypothetical protein FRC06_004397 [Ceratobasidium sp. 370]
MVKDHKHGLYVLLPGSVPRTHSFVQKFQDAVNKDSCLFGRVALYSTRDSHCPISAAFGPAISSIKACWGKNLPFAKAVLELCMIDRWAADVTVVTGEKQMEATLHFRLDFATHGWSTEVVLDGCGCDQTAAPGQRPKRWVLERTNGDGAPTTITLRCSCCEARRLLPKPDHVPSPSYHAGAWYRAVGPVPPENKPKRGKAIRAEEKR